MVVMVVAVTCGNKCEPMSFIATCELVTILTLMLYLEQTGLDEISDFQGDLII